MNTLYRAAFAGRPAFDTALSRALLREVADGAGAALRLYAPDDVLAFSGLDRTRPGFARAVDAARDAGFTPVIRLAGGRAALFHRGTLAFAWSVPCPDPRRGVRERFDTMAGMAERALRRLGVDAHVGAVPGEYCPGDHSVNARGSVKLVGVGQRVMRGAAHVGGVIVVNDAKRVRDGLVPVYRELELEMDPEAVGSVEDEVGGVTLDGVVDALLQEFAEHGPWREGEFRPDQLERAAELESQHRC